MIKIMVIILSFSEMMKINGSMFSGYDKTFFTIYHQNSFDEVCNCRGKNNQSLT